MSLALPTRIKICGISTVADAQMVANAGVDAIGLVFYEPSPRYVDSETAAKIAQAVGPFVSVVGLFVDASADEVNNIIAKVGLNLLQFHGEESAEYCEQFRLPYMKALRMREGLDVISAAAQYTTASGILLDAYQKGTPGGTGESFDWERVPQNLTKPIVLAGGLRPSNVAQAIEQVNPYGLDVSGGVESSPSCKDQHMVTEFITNIRMKDALTRSAHGE